MLPSLPYLRASLLYLLSKFRPRLSWMLGRPIRITISPWCEGGYMLQIQREQGVEWIRLTTDPGRPAPDSRDLDAAADALTARGLTWVPPFGLDANGYLTAPVVAILSTPKRSPFALFTLPTDPGTPGTEDPR